MAKYQVLYSKKFNQSLDKMDKPLRKQILHWIDTHLKGVDFPKTPGKPLTNQLSGLVRFRIGNYRLIAHVDKKELVILALYVAHRSEAYNMRLFIKHI